VVIFEHFSRFFLRWERQAYGSCTYGASHCIGIFCESMNQWLRMHLKCEISGQKTCWALPPQGQGLSHLIQLLEVLPYQNQFHITELVFFMKVFRLFRMKRIFLGVHTVDTVRRCTTSYLLAGPACLWCLVMLWNRPWKNHHQLREQQLTLPGSPHSGWNWTCSIVKIKKTRFTFQVLESCQIGRYSLSMYRLLG